ncbi:MAG: nucleoside deaminase [Bdellovibrio sp.]|jgi:guanine deaminase
MQESKKIYMREAIRLARENMLKGHGGPFGAVIVKSGQIIGRGWNKVTSANDPTAHAEVEAIRQACQNLGTFELSGAEIYTSCEPCPMCLSAIYWARLDRIYFANTRTDAAQILFDDDLLYQEIQKKIEDRKIPMVALLRDEALGVFAEWQKKSDKISY